MLKNVEKPENSTQCAKPDFGGEKCGFGRKIAENWKLSIACLFKQYLEQ